jgi:hypothetical protein
VALACVLLAVFLLAQLLVRSRSEKPLDTTGWQLADFIDHLQRREVKLHVAWGPRSKKLYQHQLYLTEDPDATWSALQHKVVNVQCIDQWHGTVWVGYPNPWTDVEDEALYEWGEYGCRIGNFILFGDDRLLRRIQEACR